MLGKDLTTSSRSLGRLIILSPSINPGLAVPHNSRFCRAVRFPIQVNKSPSRYFESKTNKETPKDGANVLFLAGLYGNKVLLG